MAIRSRIALPLTGLFASVALAIALAPAQAQSQPAPVMATEMTADIAAELVVSYDQVMLQPLERPAAQIIVGNPSIAEVTLQASNVLAITGKTFGVTNLIVLDADQKQIWNSKLMVKADDKTVTLVRGTGSSTYSCPAGSRCQPMLKVGDEKEQFGLIATTSTQKMKLSESQDASPPSN